jgi:hypothetical protein
LLKDWQSTKKYGKALIYGDILSTTQKFSLDNPNHQPLIGNILSYQWNCLRILHVNKKDYSHAEFLKGTPQKVKEITELMEACLLAKRTEIFNNAVSHIISHVDLYPPLELTSFLNKARVTDSIKQEGYQKLLGHVLHSLKKERGLGLREKDDWSILEKPSCSCEDCAALVEFLQSQILQIKVWPMGKERRSHIHHHIDGLGIPVTHVTKREGSPHKLVLTKTEALYNQAKQRFDRIEQELGRLSSEANSLSLGRVRESHP